MRKFQVTVNGNTYEVDVEELGTGASASAAAPAPTAFVPQAQGIAPQQSSTPAAAPQQASAPVSSSGAVGSVLLESPMQGKIIGVKVDPGQSVAEGEVVAILEAMKMENEIVAPQAGTIATVDVAAGQSVEAGDLIVSLN